MGSLETGSLGYLCRSVLAVGSRRRWSWRKPVVAAQKSCVGPPAVLRVRRIKLDADCDVVVLVIMDSATLEAREILEARYAAVVEVLV